MSTILAMISSSVLSLSKYVVVVPVVRSYVSQQNRDVRPSFFICFHTMVAFSRNSSESLLSSLLKNSECIEWILNICVHFCFAQMVSLPFNDETKSNLHLLRSNTYSKDFFL